MSSLSVVLVKGPTLVPVKSVGYLPLTSVEEEFLKEHVYRVSGPQTGRAWIHHIGKRTVPTVNRWADPHQLV